MKTLITFLLVLVSGAYAAQTITGTLTQAAGQNLVLWGYNGLQTTKLASTIVPAKGSFTLNYNANYKGMGYLKIGKTTMLVVLNEPNIVINGTNLTDLSSISYKNSLENSLFTQYSVLYNNNDAALKGWQYLLPQYQIVDGLKTHQNVYHTIVKEIKRLQNVNNSFLTNLDASLYVKWYLPMMKLVNQMPASVKTNPQQIPTYIAAFRKINFNSKQFYHSGLLGPLLAGHYTMLAYSGLSLDSMYTQMNTSTDYLIKNLAGNDSLLNEVSNFLFHLMEKNSWFTASEHLAISMLSNNSCALTPELADQLETYRAMKVGNIAPDIVFTGEKMMKGKEISSDKKLSTMNNNYTLIVFGASWCPKCAKEIPKISKYYQKWKAKGLAVVFVSLDTKKEDFTQFVQHFPFLSSCDFKGWKTQAARDYYVFATPTLFLLAKNLKILVRPISLAQVDAWVNYKLTTNNKKL